MLQKAKDLRSKQQTPVVIFDLDDTLFDSRFRTLQILREFVATPTIFDEHQAYSVKLNSLGVNQFSYCLKSSLQSHGLSDVVFLKKAQEFWRERFFTNQYVKLDLPIIGSVELVGRLFELGIHIVYLTGRDEMGMGQGTRESLAFHGFPTVAGISLLLKPNFEMDDGAFKSQAVAEIEKIGQPIAIFENEPLNLDLLGDAFPEAARVFLETNRSDLEAVPARMEFVLKNYVGFL